MSFPYLAKTTLKYKSPHATDLSFAKDETIRVTGQSDDDEDWLIGESMDGSRSGGFPRDFVMQVEETEESATAGQSESATEKPSQAPVADPAPASAQPPTPQSPKNEPSSQITPTPDPPPAARTAPPASLSNEKVPTPSVEGDEPSQRSMKDRLAFFTAAQGKAGPPPPVKPKPATGGLTWSQRQKLKQEQEAKEREGGEAPAAGAPPASEVAPAPTPTPASPATDSQPPKQEKREGTGMSAADAQTSIGKGGSLKERMAALQGAGAFGKSDEPKSTPPAPSGKVWKRPAAPPAPEPEEGDDEGAEATGGESMRSPMTEQGAGLDEAGSGAGAGVESEQNEEEAEKARKAAIAARMAKLGARGPMGMALPPKPARKPTKEALASPTTEEKPPVSPTAVPEATADNEQSKDEAAIASPPTSVPMPAIARRTAPPRRRGGPPSSNAVPSKEDPPEAEKQFESIGPNDGAEPPPQVMVYDEEKPLPKTDEELAMEKEYEAAGKGEGGAEGARAAGIALAPASSQSGDEANVTAEAKSSQGSSGAAPVVGAVGGAGEPSRGSGADTTMDAGDIDTENDGEPVEVEDGLEEGGQEKDDIMLQAQAGNLSPATQEPEMVPLHSPAESPMLDDAQTPPPPPPRVFMSDMPKDEVDMKHPHDQPSNAEDEEGEEEEDDADVLPPPPPQRDARRSIGGGEKPLGPRPLPSPGAAALPPPPTGNAMVPPRDDSEDEREAEGQGDEEDENEEDEAPPPPPPARKPSMPVATGTPAAELTEPESPQEDEEAPPPPPPARKPSMQVATGTPAAEPAVRSAVPQSPMSLKRNVPPAPGVEEETQPQSAEDEEATRRSNIAARMAKLGGIKFGAPPPVPATKRSMSTGPTSAVDENPKSPIREVPPPPPHEEDEEAPPAEAQRTDAVQPAEDGEETPEQEAARRRATLARLRAGGSLGFGMFGQGGGGSRSATSPSDERGLEQEAIREAEEEGSENVPPAPPARPLAKEEEDDEDDTDGGGAPPPPPPPGRPGNQSRSPTANSNAGAGESSPPPTSARPPIPANRPVPPPPAPAPLSEQPESEDEGAGAPPPPPPPPPARPAQSPPQSPIGSRPPIPTDKRSSMSQIPPPTPIRTDMPAPPMTEEPSDMDTAPPPPARTPTSPRRSTSIASRSSAQPMTPASRQGSRLEDPIAAGPGPGAGAGAGEGRPTPRSSVSQGRPGFNDLQEASKQHGSKLIRAAKGIFQQGKQAYYGDGSPAGFVLVAMDQAHLPRPQNQWGCVILEQEGSTVLKRSDEPRPGDIAAFYDAKLKGKKGLSSYSQNVGSVEEPLVGIVSESETKKRKLRVLQVERGTPDEVSYRCDDLKSGRVVVFRPGI